MNNLTILHNGFPTNPNYVPDVDAEVAEFMATYEDETEPGILICNETAREIAAWYQSENGNGFHFAVFASSGAVTEGMIDAIDAELEIPAETDDPAAEERALLALRAHIRSYLI